MLGPTALGKAKRLVFFWVQGSMRQVLRISGPTPAVQIVLVTACLRLCGLPADSNKRRRATQQRNAVVPGKCMTAAENELLQRKFTCMLNLMSKTKTNDI